VTGAGGPTAERPGGSTARTTGTDADDVAERAATVPAAGEGPRRPRPLIERLGLAAIALVLAVLFGAVAYSAWIGGEPFLAVMGGIGCLMTAWVGGLTLLRG
jgi:hypothetical protein